MSGYLIHCPTRNEFSYIRLNPNDKIITIDDEIPTDFASIRGSILLPPASLMFSYVDSGDRISFSNSYYNYLSSETLDRMLTMIWVSLFRGNNIVLFNNNSDSEMFLSELSQYMYNVFGMCLCNVDNPCEAINVSVIPNILYKAYMYGYISAEEYNYYVAQANQPQQTQMNYSQQYSQPQQQNSQQNMPAKVVSLFEPISDDWIRKRIGDEQ